MAAQNPVEVQYEVIVWGAYWTQSPQLLVFDDLDGAYMAAEEAFRHVGVQGVGIFQDNGRRMTWVAGFGPVPPDLKRRQYGY